MKVNKLWSAKTQLPYRYYELPFCRPKKIRKDSESIGEILMGDRRESSAYQLFVKYNEYCKHLCRMSYNAKQVKHFSHMIEQEYTVSWVLDNLPAAVLMKDEAHPDELHYERGFPLGIVGDNGARYLFNHIHFIVHYHTDPDYEGSRIVGFVVRPYSVKHKYEGEYNAKKTQLSTCNDAHRVTSSSNLEWQRIDQPGEVIYTYDVEWVESEVPWAQRWNMYLEGVSDDEIHWFSIINSLMIVLFLTGMIAMIVLRALYRDIARYNEDNVEDAAEESGWKLVHGDVFRPPRGFFGPMVLSVFVGSGSQLLMMTGVLMVFAVLGFLSPANRGGLVTAMLLLFVFMGSAGGYFSARLYKMFHGKAWKRNTLLTAVLFPGTIAVVAFIVNLFVWGTGSSAAIPFGTMFAVLVLWFGVSMPLVFLGAYFGFKKEEVKHPVRVNQIPRQVPPQPWYLSPLPSILVGGVLPFGAVFIELFFIMSSIWLAQVYYLFGFLLLVMVILVITCAEISIVMCYFQLCAEDYNWWWRSFLTSGSSALYLFAYSVLYFCTKLEINLFVSSLLYFAYMVRGDRQREGGGEEHQEGVLDSGGADLFVCVCVCALCWSRRR